MHNQKNVASSFDEIQKRKRIFGSESKFVTFPAFAAHYSVEAILSMTLKLIIGVCIGGGIGFAYYKFIGCPTGACPLTSNPYIEHYLMTKHE